MPHALDKSSSSPERMTLTQAARLTVLPKAYLRELIESGRLSVYLVPDAGEIKQRVTRAGLVDAGLIPSTPSELDRDLSELISLVREQSSRIGTLEEQRFQLGAQLGAAFERIASLEEQVQSLPVLQSEHAAELDLEVGEPEPVAGANGRQPAALTLRSAAARFGELGVQGSSALGSIAARQSVRFFARARRQARRA
jgi:hypothetical protein